MTTTVFVKLVSITCCECGIVFGIPEEFDDGRRSNHKSFFCPLGHSLSYPGKSTEERLRDQLELERAKTEREKRNAEAARRRADSLERSRNVYKGKLTSVKKRIAGGVCPCCKRSFQNLKEHMKNKHPSYTKEEVA